MDKVLYRPSWQKLRVSTLKEHNPYGGMTTEAGANDALSRMENYITDVQAEAPYVLEECKAMNISLVQEAACRVYRVNSFLSSTINGLSGTSMPGYLDSLRSYQHNLTPIINVHAVQQVEDGWNWNVVRTELTDMWIAERMWFLIIREDMQQRIVEKNQTAPSMLMFTSIMDEINRIG